MSQQSAQQQLIRFGGFAALAFAGLLLFQMAAYRLAGVDIYSENYALTLAAIPEHRTLFTLSMGAGALSAACLLPIALAFFYSTKSEDQPFALLSCSFIVLSAALMIEAYAHAGNLVGTAVDYMRSSQSPIVVQVGDSMADQFQITQYAAIVSMALGSFGLTWLMKRSSTYPSQVILLTAAVGISGLCFNRLPAPFMAIRVVWAVMVGVSLLRSVERELAIEPELGLAEA